VAKYADRLPLYRQEAIYARDGGRAAVIYFASLFVFWQIAGRADGFEAKAIALLRMYFRKVMVQFGQ
jgi:hypothetical protein